MIPILTIMASADWTADDCLMFGRECLIPVGSETLTPALNAEGSPVSKSGTNLVTIMALHGYLMYPSGFA